ALPHCGFGHDLVGNRADEIGRDLRAVVLCDKRLDLAHAHPARVHRNDAFVEAAEAPLVLGDQDRLEAAVPVTRYVDPDRAPTGEYRLARAAVALVGLLGRLRRP